MVGGETKLGYTHLVHADWSTSGTNTNPAGKKKLWQPRNIMTNLLDLLEIQCINVANKQNKVFDRFSGVSKLDLWKLKF